MGFYNEPMFQSLKCLRQQMLQTLLKIRSSTLLADLKVQVL